MIIQLGFINEDRIKRRGIPSIVVECMVHVQNLSGTFRDTCSVCPASPFAHHGTVTRSMLFDGFSEAWFESVEASEALQREPSI